MKKIIPLFLFLLIAFSSQAQEKKAEVCDCPEPTKDQFTSVCQAIYDKEVYEGSGPFSYVYQENLWELSCVKPNESIEIAKIKYNVCGVNTDKILDATAILIQLPQTLIF